MNEFVDAAQAGKKSAKIAESNEREVRETVAKLSEAIAAVYGGNIEVKIRSYQKRPTILAESQGREGDIERSLVASRKDVPTATAFLAQIQYEDQVYPVTVYFGDEDLTSHDREALIVSFKEMLAHPLVGKKLLQLQSAQAPQKAK